MTDFQPYWLVHEPGKTHGFATVPVGVARTPEEAVGAWRATADPAILEMFDLYNTPTTARLITEPFNKEA